MATRKAPRERGKCPQGNNGESRPATEGGRDQKSLVRQMNQAEQAAPEPVVCLVDDAVPTTEPALVPAPASRMKEVVTSPRGTVTPNADNCPLDATSLTDAEAMSRLRQAARMMVTAAIRYVQSTRLDQNDGASGNSPMSQPAT